MDNNFEQFNGLGYFEGFSSSGTFMYRKRTLKKGYCNVGYMQECLHLPQSTVSQHLQKLRNFGIVKTERNGLKVNYTIADDRVKQLIHIFFGEDKS